ncbi:uncharacterized protein MONOS_9780 [Monocercomonoides exilis]|uniref:uncharacterized protein n=1 Tax=Monocercomonoides exilis TaxID=2049356 RepID=UPI003559E42A|nr:hypothetical protein MONOS_9780 [Monocercomonoides exilis]|eukprot:MONOS_9780.1-p1 / transcript=MONOS_9780.1 / gene=MONOS_9780 / organism=Monocercomonoides_exilis_PA203 / gene_product=unspecified product / transcript_product=unspecified product / location=Mono_scaffold00417:4841-5083(-) / protein_length=81 / sequence_SO=supercontig / SO=protein_coding / is_pseudo=false
MLLELYVSEALSVPACAVPAWASAPGCDKAEGCGRSGGCSVPWTIPLWTKKADTLHQPPQALWDVLGRSPFKETLHILPV